MIRQIFALTLLIIAATTLAISQENTTLSQPPTALAHALTPSGIEPAAKTRKVKVYLVAVNDAGKSGRKIGCDDSLVAVKRDIAPTAAPLKAALEELVSIPRTFSDQLGNYVFGPDLKVESVVIRRGTATIRFSGEISVVGICDQPRITEQIEQTAKQFRNVRRVRVFVGNRTLKNAIS